MIVINCFHPLTAEQLQQLEELLGSKVERVIEIDAHIDLQQPIAPQVAALAEQAGLTSKEWQTLPILVVPPSLNFSAVTLLAELHGRMGYFPPVLRLRPVAGSIPPRFEVAEIINLQEVREKARERR